MRFRNPFKKCEVVGEGVSNAAYMKQEAVRGSKDYVMSRSSLMEFARCPHKWIQTPERESSKALDWGSLVDCLLFTPDAFGEQFAVKPETYTNEKGEVKDWNGNSNTCKQWLRENAHLTAITALQLLHAKEAVKRLRMDKKVGALLNQSKFQVMIRGFYHDWETGLDIPCKVLMDMVPDSRSQFSNALADLKTAEDATAQKWSRKVSGFDYDAQGAMQLDMFNAESGQIREEFLHVIQESEPPYEIGRRSLSQEFLEIGRHKYLSALRLYAVCLANNEWPGYDDTTNDIEDGWRLCQPEPWMMKETPFAMPQRDKHTAEVGDPLSAA